jgi:hypothetical protein
MYYSLIRSTARDFVINYSLVQLLLRHGADVNAKVD